MSSEDMSGQVRRVLAAMLGGVARGLTASARTVEQASWVLRPRESAAERGDASETIGGPGAGVEATGPAGVAEPADGTESDAADVMEPGGVGIAAPETPPEATEPLGREPSGTEPVEPVGAVEPAEAAPEEPPVTEAEAEGPPVTEAELEEPPVTEAEPAPEPAPTESAPEGPDRMKVAESHIAALAERPVADVVSELRNLSTDELEDLYAHEVTHKNRETVLRAIERAVAPSSSSS